MGIKSLVYFEVLTTLALVIGLVAINLTKAGVGLVIPAATSAGQTLTGVPPTHWDEFLLHIFPENIAKIRRGRPGPAGRGLRGSLRHRAGRLEPGEARARAAPVREPGRSDVQVHQHRDVLRAHRRGRAMAFTVGNMGLGVLVNLGKLLLTFYGALTAFALLVLLPVR